MQHIINYNPMIAVAHLASCASFQALQPHSSTKVLVPSTLTRCTISHSSPQNKIASEWCNSKPDVRKCITNQYSIERSHRTSATSFWTDMFKICISAWYCTQQITLIGSYTHMHAHACTCTHREKLSLMPLSSINAGVMDRWIHCTVHTGRGGGNSMYL